MVRAWLAVGAVLVVLVVGAVAFGVAAHSRAERARAERRQEQVADALRRAGDPAQVEADDFRALTVLLCMGLPTAQQQAACLARP